MSGQLNRRNEIVIEKLAGAIDRIGEALRLGDWSEPIKEAPDYANDESMSFPRHGKSNLLVDEAADALKELIAELSEELE
tara:strand:+ start:91 stop:330 length:240 start_codon:yes stop_codon:yes gene_type:complete